MVDHIYFNLFLNLQFVFETKIVDDNIVTWVNICRYNEFYYSLNMFSTYYLVLFKKNIYNVMKMSPIYCLYFWDKYLSNSDILYFFLNNSNICKMNHIPLIIDYYLVCLTILIHISMNFEFLCASLILISLPLESINNYLQYCFEINTNNKLA